MSKGKAESKIQNEIVVYFNREYLDQIDRLFLIHNNPKNDIHGAILLGLGLRKGASDLGYIGPGGIFHGIEVKRPGENPSEAQIKFRDRITQAGAQYHVVRSVEEFAELIRKINRTPNESVLTPKNTREK